MNKQPHFRKEHYAYVKKKLGYAGANKVSFKTLVVKSLAKDGVRAKESMSPAELALLMSRAIVANESSRLSLAAQRVKPAVSAAAPTATVNKPRASSAKSELALRSTLDALYLKRYGTYRAIRVVVGESKMQVQQQINDMNKRAKVWFISGWIQSNFGKTFFYANLRGRMPRPPDTRPFWLPPLTNRP